MSVTATQLHQLYLAYFGRPPDVGGMNYYLAQPSATVDSVCAAFSTSPESRAMYGTTFNAAAVDAIYMNVFNRHAEAGAVTYWTGEVSSGRLSAAMAAYGIMVGAQGSDATSVANKLSASQLWYAHLNTPDKQNAYGGASAANCGRWFLHNVTSTSSTLTVAQQEVDYAITAMMTARSAEGVAGVAWTQNGQLPGVRTDEHYTPLVIGRGSFDVFMNASQAGNPIGRMYGYQGGFDGIGSERLVLTTPAGPDAFVRTLAVCRGHLTGRYYALLDTGDKYDGNTTGFSPSFADSTDGMVWSWKGHVSPFARTFGSSAAMVVDEARTDDYRFMAWCDNVSTSFRMMHSADGLTWVDGGQVAPLANDIDPVFATACRTPHGVHLITAYQWPATAHRHLFSKDGITGWKMLETNCPTFINTATTYKGTNLCYDARTGLIQALTSSNLSSCPARAF